MASSRGRWDPGLSPQLPCNKPAGKQRVASAREVRILAPEHLTQTAS